MNTVVGDKYRIKKIFVTFFGYYSLLDLSLHIKIENLGFGSCYKIKVKKPKKVYQKLFLPNLERSQYGKNEHVNLCPKGISNRKKSHENFSIIIPKKSRVFRLR